MKTDSGIVIVVARNNKHLTRQTVGSALKLLGGPLVHVVDNCSTDGTAQWLQALRSTTTNVVVSTMVSQASLSHCWNVALRQAWKWDFEHALVCNNDIELRPDTYKKLLAHGGPFVTCVSVDTPERLGTTEHVPSSERPHPDFSCFLIRKSVTDKAGWFNEEFFPAYCEDSDYHVRMHRAGIRAVCIDLPFLHHGAATLKYANPLDRSHIRHGSDKNRRKFYEMYGCFPGSKEYERLFE